MRNAIRGRTRFSGMVDDGLLGPIPWKISDCYFYCSAKFISGIADGGTISTWDDQSSNGNDLIGGSGNLPLYRASINGYPAVDFNNNKYVTFPAYTYDTNGSSIFILQRTTGDSMIFGSTTDNRQFRYFQDGNRILLYDGGMYYSPYFEDSNGGWSLIEAIRPNSTTTWYQNGKSMGTQDVSGTFIYNTIGKLQSYGDRLQGYIRDVAIFDRALNDGERIAIENYILKQYDMQRL